MIARLTSHADIVVAAETMRAPEVYPITEQRDRLYGQAPTTSEHSQSPAPHLNTEISLDAVGRLSPSTSVEHRVGFQQERDAGIVIATETMVAPELYPIAEQQDRPYAYGTAPTTSEHSQVPVPHSSNATSLQAVGHLSSSTSVEHQVHFHQDRNAGIVIAAETIRAPELYPITEQQDHPYAYGTAPTTSEHSQVPVPHSSTATSLQAVGQSSSSTSVEHPVRSHQDRNAGIVVTAETTRAPELYSIAEQQDHPFGPALTASEHAQGPVPYLNTAVSLEAIGRSSSSINFEHQARLQQDYLEQDRLQQEALQQAHPHQAAFTTSEHPQGTEARLTTSTSPHIVGRSLSRRVSNASSSDVDDEQEIPVSFNPEVAHTLAPHLQENLRSIEHESQQKAIAKAERNARVASGNSFSHFNAASGPPAQQVPSR